MEKVSNIVPHFKAELLGIAQEREVISWVYIVILHLLGYNRSDYIIHANKEITTEISDDIKQIIEELKRQKPLQYILGEVEFYGLKFKLNKHTLIPRPETEELVRWVLEEQFNSALDIGTGSGCISITLAKHSNATISAIDISEMALKVAKENAAINEVKIDFIQQNILQANSLQKVDVIVSNPPYVLESEKQKMKANILQYEPHLALFIADKEPLLFYKKIGNLAAKSLNCGGKLYFEINEQYGVEILEMLSKIGFVDIALKKDINDKDRMIKAIWK
ncbi:peptide chain release factor N(5)-glutamine methyltransferase [Flavobacteriales bacterium]|nr:peptide chain release factor N(5)-glutamine methyltransferase [Flavobacteriales bacterium]